jgi:nucleoside-diphosphate-sugar epimerase
MGESTVHASAKFSGWSQGRRCGVAITGASGWIGRAMAHAVLEANGSGPIRLFGSRAGLVEAAGRTLPLEALEGAPPLGDGEWIVLHLAVAGADRVAEPEALRALNDGLLASVFALMEGARVRRFVSASSGAVHQLGQGSPEKQAYAALKQSQELAARSWARRANRPLLIPRIFNVGGPYMNHAERYALGDFVRQALAGGVIEIGATRPVIRSYVHVLELARVVLDLALSDTDDIVVETEGAAAVEMEDLAEAVGRALGLKLDIRRPRLTSDSEDRYVGDGALYRAALGGEPAGLDQIIRATAVGFRT